MQSTHSAIPQKRNINVPFQRRNLFDLAAPEVYPNETLLFHTVSSYLTFSPLSRPEYSGRDGNFLRYFLSFAFQRNPTFIKRQDALCCPDFPPPINRGRWNVLHGKDNKKKREKLFRDDEEFCSAVFRSS